MIAITFALSAESSGFLRRLRRKSRIDQNSVRIIRGEIDGLTIEVLDTGVGRTICRERIAAFLQDRQFKYLISAGFAGALNDRLHVGDLVLAENFSTVEQRGVRAALSTLPIHGVNLVTVPSMIDSAAERKRIAETTGAEAADMETEFIARACAKRALPLLSLRVISDTPSEPLPAPAQVLFHVAKQRTNLAKLSVFLLQHPSRVPRLVGFAKRIAQARGTLADALVRIIRAIK
jgi:adenosylhomocysteine nucleosidase